MHIPAQKVEISAQKITDYLLVQNEKNDKSEFLSALGYKIENWIELEKDIRALVEINEAFAAQFIGCEKELGLNRDICNVNGGAIALGHPLAATGTRLSLTLSREMNIRKVKYGIASACIGGGQGTAILFENTNLQLRAFWHKHLAKNNQSQKAN